VANHAPRDVAPRYDEIADFYHGAVGDAPDDPAAEALLSFLPDVYGLAVLDLACGQGRVSRELARRGARVMGVDVSAALLQKARAQEELEPLGILYEEADVSSADLLPDARFRVITCHFGLSDIDDLRGVLENVARLLEHDGSFTHAFRVGVTMRPVAGRPARATSRNAGGSPKTRASGGRSAPATGCSRHT
jgi:ubiquinone/menaquinone biosynthesis C-methylase UbiE